jgi:hypothetical protein
MHTHHDHSEHTATKHTAKDFVPLIVIFAVVIGFTLITLRIQGTSAVQDVMRFFMGYFFLVFGGFKVIRWKGFVDAYATYDLIAMRSRVYGYAYPLIELGLAVLYLSGLYLTPTNVITLVVMLVGAIGVYRKLKQHETIPCACLGVVFKIPMTYVTLIEDLLMAVMAGGMLLLG